MKVTRQFRVGHRQPPEGRGRANGSQPRTPTITSCVRPSERPKLIDSSAKECLIRRPGRSDGRTRERHREGCPTRLDPETAQRCGVLSREKHMAQRPKRAGQKDFIGSRSPKELSRHLVEWNESRSVALDMDSLRKELTELAHVIEPIAIPSKEAWEGMLVERSLNVPFKNEQLYWAYHAYFGSEKFRAAVDDYNTEVRISGLVELAQRKAPEENSAASNILRAIEDKRPSSALLDSWFHFGVLLGRQHELLEANRDQKGLFQRGLKSGAASATIGQQVWYARWLKIHWLNKRRDRATVESELAEMCNDLVRERRQVHTRGKQPSSLAPVYPSSRDTS